MFVSPSLGIGVNDIGVTLEVNRISAGSLEVIKMLSEIEPIVVVSRKLVVDFEMLLRIVDDAGSATKQIQCEHL